MEAKLGLVVILIVTLLLDQNAAELLPGVDTYRNFLGVGRFRMITPGSTYTEAVRVCKSEEAHLAVPTSKGIHDALLEILRSEKVEMAYVGINDIDKEGKMVTLTGELYSNVGYTPWAYGEPNNAEEEDCVAFTWNGLLNDIKCQDSKGHEFICEKDNLVPHNPY